MKYMLIIIIGLLFLSWSIYDLWIYNKHIEDAFPVKVLVKESHPGNRESKVFTTYNGKKYIVKLGQGDYMSYDVGDSATFFYSEALDGFTKTNNQNFKPLFVFVSGFLLLVFLAVKKLKAKT